MSKQTEARSGWVLAIIANTPSNGLTTVGTQTASPLARCSTCEALPQLPTDTRGRRNEQTKVMRHLRV
eukprot:3889091-Lingulodinium_polyedra.AAC.1